ncbi:lysyl-tRNA synthetase class 2 [Desulfosalsimonas propionicica]|uniref:Lysyl-tRNA synthetase class 2 n=1 Tax=Desulfosalsimonas propionicica TaxID=332175 RepID=A0A7W0HJ61_9BACT|nr:EF-P lysine aminoacylase EpmA [Desulfosalsimonas propionicica]MBA2879845.1 lysyl-tRNA synthetase class 2 [Desulfosalsimonas propionicica]
MTVFRQQGIRHCLQIRHRLLNAVRAFFCRHDFLEVETPVRTPAPAPEAHIEAISADGAFLQTSPELYMKRLLAAGYPRIFQICRTFRAKERGSRHLPEFTMLEWYAADFTYQEMMNQTESLICETCEKVLGTRHLRRHGTAIRLDRPWPKITVEKAFQRFAHSTMNAALADQSFDERMAMEIEPALDPARPIFLYDYPAEKAALARLRNDNPHVAERFEAYIGGLEICNGFSELIDPDQQRRRFEMELKRREKQGLDARPMPEAFLAALGRMPPAAGNALGIDRLAMLLSNAETIDEVSAFVPEED